MYTTRLQPVYTAVIGSCTDHVHCARMYTVRGRPCTQSVHNVWTAVYTDRKHGRVHDTRAVNTALFITRTRPSTGRVHCRYRVMHDRVQVRTRPCTERVHRPQTRPCSWPVRGIVRSRTLPCSVHVRPVHGPYTALYTGRIHYRVRGRRPCTRAVNTAAFTARTRPCAGRVHGP